MRPSEEAGGTRPGPPSTKPRARGLKPVLSPWPDLGYTARAARQKAVNLAHEIYPEIPIPALSGIALRTRRWIGDTGTSRHIGSADDLTSDEKRTIRTAAKPITLATAAGPITIDKEVDVRIPQLRGVTINVMKLLEIT